MARPGTWCWAAGLWACSPVRILLSAGHPVVFVEVNVKRRAALAERGFPVAHTVPAAEGPFSTVIDCAGSPELVPGALELLRPHGRYLVVGYSKVPAFDLSVVSRRELTVEGVRSGRRVDLEDILALVARGQLSPPPITTWPLAEINGALRALREGDVLGKAVVLFPPAEAGQPFD